MKRKPLYLLLGYPCYRFPTLGRHLWSVFDRVEHRRHQLLSNFTKDYSDKPPTHIVDVDPTDIIYCKKIFNIDMAGRVIGGNWDQNLPKFEDNEVYQCLKKRYNQGHDWCEIEYVNHCINAVKDGQTVWQNCTTVEEIHEHCSNVDNLYKSIKERGILKPVELLEERKRTRPYNIPKLNIGRNGELILNSDGTHRTALAKIIGVEKMPVWICVRHKQWQAARDQISVDNSVPSKYQDHPDLVDLRSS